MALHRQTEKPGMQPKVLHRLPTGDSVIDRVQDHFIGILNPFIKKVSNETGTLPFYNLAGRPAPGGVWLGRMIRVKDPNTPETVQLCMSLSDGKYEWVTIATASF